MDTSKLKLELLAMIKLVENMRLIIPELEQLALRTQMIYSNSKGFVLHINTWNAWKDYKVIRKHFGDRLKMLDRSFEDEQQTYYLTFRLDDRMNLRLCVHANREKDKAITR